MDRTLPTIDLFTLVGMMATIAGILLCLLFLFAPTTFGATNQNGFLDQPPDLQISMRWIQPILGQAIVEDALIRHRRSQVEAETAALDGPNAAASAQWVVGRVIVELHRSRMAGGLPADGHSHAIQRIVTIARHAAKQFVESQPTLF